MDWLYGYVDCLFLVSSDVLLVSYDVLLVSCDVRSPLETNRDPEVPSTSLRQADDSEAHGKGHSVNHTSFKFDPHFVIGSRISIWTPRKSFYLEAIERVDGQLFARLKPITRERVERMRELDGLLPFRTK